MNLIYSCAQFVPRSLLERVAELRWRHPRLETAFLRLADRLRDQESVIQRGAAAGLRFIPARSHAGYLLGIIKPELQAFFESHLRPGMTAYDIGANVGFFSMIAARIVGAGGRVECFEPVPTNVAALRNNARLNGFGGVAVHEMALGRENTEAAFWLSEQPTWGHLTSIGQMPDRVSGRSRVIVRRLDTVVEAENLRPPDLIKIDVEGAELEVLEGASATLLRYRPVLAIEMHGRNREAAELLGRMGYRAGVLGSAQELADAYWNCQAVAFPAGKNTGRELRQPAPPAGAMPVRNRRAASE